MRIIHRRGERIVVELDDEATARVRVFMAKGHCTLHSAAGRDPRDMVSAAVVYLLDDPDLETWTSSDECHEQTVARRLALEQEETA